MRIANWHTLETVDTPDDIGAPLCTALVLRLDFPLLSSLRRQLCG